MYGNPYSYNLRRSTEAGQGAYASIEAVESTLEQFNYIASYDEVQIVDQGNAIFNSFIGVNRLPTGAINIGDYLAAGAFGQVYRGKWGERHVALKKIDFEHASRNLNLDKDQILESLSWEVSRLSTTMHPNIVQFYGIYQQQNQDYTYLVMEFCEGGELRKVLQKNANISWSKRWQWALELSEGLEYLHHQGILHRDLKAENILLDSNGRAKLADLGVAQVDALLAKEEALVVAIGLQDKRFIAPENIADQRLSSKATDIYALGLVFWEIATGKEPKVINMNLNYFKDWEKGKHIMREVIPMNCPAGFRDLILSCWSKDPKARPSAEELVKKLNQIAPEFNDNHGLVRSCGQLEKLIHPKRKEGLSYIAPFVTEHKVEESMESYWSRWEGVENKESKNPPLKLDDTFKEFIETPGAKTLLLLGEAGLGKTLTTYLWADQLLQQWWAYTSHNKQIPAYFPLFIRPSVSEWTHKSIKGAYHNAVKKYNIPIEKDIPKLVFVDGYDECQMDEEAANLVDHLGLSEVANAKLIVTCRPNVVDRSELTERFGFKGQLQTRHFLPFSVDQLLGYLKEQLSWGEKYQEYKKTLENAPSVRTVLRNPFVLYLMRQSWETVSKKALNRLTRWQIYEAFIEHIIDQQKGLLSEGVQESLQSNHSSLLRSFQAFASAIAFKAFQKYNIKIGMKEAASGVESEWLNIEQHVEVDSERQFTERQAKFHQMSDERKEKVGRRTLLSKEDYVRMRQKSREQLEDSLPLKLRGGEYEYSHKSLFEYFMAKHLIMLRDHDSNSVVEEGMNLLQERPVQEEREALQFWEEGWAELESLKLIEPLFRIIEHSKTNEKVLQASTNAATLLAAARTPFSSRDLSGVRIRDADLSSAVLSYTCLYRADLQNVVLKGAYLGDADLREANLDGVNFGEFPSIQCMSEVHCVNYSKDGRFMVLGLQSGIIEYLSLNQEGYRLLGSLKDHTDSVSSVCYSPDGKQLASGSWDCTVKLWDTSTNTHLSTLKHTSSVSSVSYSPDGKQLASGSGDNTVMLWDTATATHLSTLKGHTGAVCCVSYSPDGKQLASGGGYKDHMVILWDAVTATHLRTLKGHRSGVSSICYSPDGKQLASGGSGSDDLVVMLWDTVTATHLSTLKGHNGLVMSVSYSPDGKQLASGSGDNTVMLWDTTTATHLSTLKGHTGAVFSVSYSPNGKQLVSGSNDKTVMLWDTVTATHCSTLKGQWSVTSISYSPDGKQLASGSYDNTVMLWDTATATHLSILKEHTSSVTSVSYSPNGKQLASGSYDNTVILWDTVTTTHLSTLKGHTGLVMSVSYSPNGKQLATGSLDNTVKLWDTTTTTHLSTLKHTSYVRSVSYSSDGKQLASGGGDNMVMLWDTTTATHLSTLKGHTHEVASVSYSPDGKQLASGSYDHTVMLWDTATATHFSTLKGHTGLVVSVSYSPNGKQLASASDDKTIMLWDTTTTTHISTLKGHTSITSVSYSPDGKQLASGSGDGAIFLWAKQNIVCSPKGEGKWQLIHRFENNSSLFASNAYLKGANISQSNLALLKQRGANETQEPLHHPHFYNHQPPNNKINKN